MTDELVNTEDLGAIVERLKVASEAEMRLFVLGRAVQIAQGDSGSSGIKALELIVSLAELGDLPGGGRRFDDLDAWVDGLSAAEMEALMKQADRMLDYYDGGERG